MSQNHCKHSMSAPDPRPLPGLICGLVLPSIESGSLSEPRVRPNTVLPLDIRSITIQDFASDILLSFLCACYLDFLIVPHPCLKSLGSIPSTGFPVKNKAHVI